MWLNMRVVNWDKKNGMDFTQLENETKTAVIFLFSHADSTRIASPNDQTETIRLFYM